MRIWTDKIGWFEMRACANIAGVSFFKLEERRSRYRDHAWEFRLEGLGQTGKRQLNFGDGYTLAATWDEWGIFLGALFRMDPYAVAAGAHGYRGERDFRLATFDRFDDLEPKDQHVTHKWLGRRDGMYCRDCDAEFTRVRPKVIVTHDGLVHTEDLEAIDRYLQEKSA